MRPNTFLDELLVISLVYTIIMIKDKKLAKISFNIILLNLAVRMIAIFLLIDLFIFSS